MSDKTHIQLVDDDEHLLVTLGDFLASEGFEVTKARSGEQALEQLKKISPDLIVLDISMPGMGGIGFLKQITAASGETRYPVLVLTARSAMKDFFDTVDVDGFAPKPCDEAELLGKIREILGRRRAQPAPESRIGPPIGENKPVQPWPATGCMGIDWSRQLTYSSLRRY